MAKALELNPDTLAVVPSVPQAAQVKSSPTGGAQTR